MESVAVVTLVTSPAFAELAALTGPGQRAYADRLRADYVVLDRRVYPHPHYDKWQLRELFDTYDRVLYLDADLIVRPDCPDLFVVVPPDCVGGENELKSFPGQATHFATFAQRLGLPAMACPFYLNGGLIVASRAHRDLFRPPEIVPTDLPWPEQSHFNVRLVSERVPTALLPPAFNDRHRQGDYLRRSYILHYSVMSMADRLDAIRRDLAGWETLTRRGKTNVAPSRVTRTRD